VKSGACTNGQAPACLPHPQTSTVTAQRSSLGPIGVSPAKTTRCSASARDPRNVQGATPRDPKSIPPGPDLRAPKPSPIRTTGAHNRVAQPHHSVVLEQAQRGLPFVTRCESHRELDRPPPVQSDRQQRSCQHPSWRVTKSGAGLRLIWPSRPRRDQGRSTKRTDDGPPRHSTAPDPHEDPEVNRQPRRALGARPDQQRRRVSRASLVTQAERKPPSAGPAAGRRPLVSTNSRHVFVADPVAAFVRESSPRPQDAGRCAGCFAPIATMSMTPDGVTALGR
jgi:hypothetical protein